MLRTTCLRSFTNVSIDNFLLENCYLRITRFVPSVEILIIRFILVIISCLVFQAHILFSFNTTCFIPLAKVSVNIFVEEGKTTQKKNQGVLCYGILIGWNCQKSAKLPRSPYSNSHFTKSIRLISFIKVSFDTYPLEEDYSIEKSSICSCRRIFKSKIAK